jgi:hypothetical protein
MASYVLCQNYPHMGQAAFVCGGIFSSLALPTFTSDPAAATKLESIDDALALRSMIGRHHHGWKVTASTNSRMMAGSSMSSLSIAP